MKKLLTCLAIAGSMQLAHSAEPTDVTALYLQNYSAPFATTGEQLISGNERWQKLAAPWMTEGDVIDETTGTITAWHVDFQKKPNYPTIDTGERIGTMTLTPGWDGFSGTFENMKAFQTITLPAGNYEFLARRAQDWTGAENAYLVAAQGTTIPNVADLGNALASARFNTAMSPDWFVIINFKLETETLISLGVVASYSNAQQCVSIAEYIINSIEGANYRQIQALLTKAKAFDNTKYPIGTILGTYPQEKWDALQAKITEVEAFIAAGEATQEQVDAKYEELLTTISELDASLILPFKVSDDTNSTWYQIRDNRDTKSYFKIGEYASEDGLTYYDMALVMTTESDNTMDDQLFKLVKAPDPAKGYYIYSKLIEEIPLAANTTENIVLLTDTLPGTAWQFGSTTTGLHFNIYTEGDKTKQLNSYASYSPPFIGFYYPGEGRNDNGNNWEFVELVEFGQTDFTDLKALIATAIRMTAENYPTGNAENQYPQDKWDTFVAVRTAALALVEKENETPQPTQNEVDEMIITLQITIDELKASQNPGFYASTDTQTYWYTLNDYRTTKSYWKLGALTSSTDTIENQLIMVKGKPEVITDSLLFKVVKAEEPYAGYFIYSKLDDVNPITGDANINFIGINDTIPSATWLFEKSTVPSHYIISLEGFGNQINSYAGYEPPFIAFYDGGAADPGNNWKFTPAVPTTSVIDINTEKINVKVINRTIVSANAGDKLMIYNIRGQRVEADRQLSQGIYIVRIEGQTGATKVVVR